MNDRHRRSHQRHSSLIRQSGLISLAAATSVASGLLLDVVIAITFGADRATDAFFVAARIPVGLIAIVTVAVNQALVPAFSTWFVQKDEDDVRRLVSLVLTATLLSGAALAALGALVASLLMPLIAPGLTALPLATSAAMARVMFLVVPLVALAEVLRALLNARGVFVAPAAMNVIMNGVAAGVILTSSSGEIHVVVWGYAAGAASQLAFMAGIAYRQGFRYRLQLALNDPDLTSVARLATRPLVGAGLNPLARVGEQIVVSYLPPGSITILNYGYRLISAIGGTLLFRSVIVTLLPRLTVATARNDEVAVSKTTMLGLRMMLAVSIPLTAFVAVLANPFVLVVFERGAFGRNDVALLGMVLAVYSASLVGSALQRALLAPFFARLDTRIPLRNTVYGATVNLLLLPLVLAFGLEDERSVLGVAVAYSLAQYANVVHAGTRLRRLTGQRFITLLPLCTSLVIASALAAAAMAFASSELGPDKLSRIELLGRACVLGATGLVVLGLVLALVKWGASRWPSSTARDAAAATTGPSNVG